jgi:ABC-2 type transport system permease protein
MVERLGEISEIIRYKELLRNLVSRDIKVRYKRSVLGFVWVMLNPLLMMLIMNMVFSSIFRISTKNYTAYLLSGIILWNLFTQSTTTALMGFIGNSNLIKKIYLPKAIFPLSMVISAMIHFVFSLVPLFFIFLITGTPLSPYIFLLPLVLLMIFIFTYGVSLILSTLTVFFHDAKYIYDVLLLAWMYMTPIFYPESIIPQKYSFFFHLNPLYYFLSIFRASLYMDVSSLLERMMFGFFYAFVAAVAGWYLYSRNKDKIVYYL